jgi:hypothetical protein
MPDRKLTRIGLGHFRIQNELRLHVIGPRDGDIIDIPKH